MKGCLHCGGGGVGCVGLGGGRLWRESGGVGGLRGRGTRGCGAGGWFSRCRVGG